MLCVNIGTVANFMRKFNENFINPSLKISDKYRYSIFLREINNIKFTAIKFPFRIRN